MREKAFGSMAMLLGLVASETTLAVLGLRLSVKAMLEFVVLNGHQGGNIVRPFPSGLTPHATIKLQI